MTRIVTADGIVAVTAYANAYDADSRMEGVRVAITVGTDGGIVTAVHEVDEDAMEAWTQQDRDAMLARMADLARTGDIEMCDHREVTAWIMQN